MNLSNETYNGLIDNFFPKIFFFLSRILIFSGIFILILVIYFILITAIMFGSWAIFGTNFYPFNWINIPLSVFLSLINLFFVMSITYVRDLYGQTQWRYFWMVFATKVKSIQSPDKERHWCHKNCKNLWTTAYIKNKQIFFFLSKKEALLFKLNN